LAIAAASPSASRIFISYRRENAAYPVGRLAHDLRQHFPGDQVFQDIASIDPGVDFGEALQQGLDACAAVLIVIDPKWLTVSDRQGRRRLDVPDDWVRHEVAESLRRPNVRVFPVLLETEMPSAEELPEPLRPLTRRQAFPLTARHWTNDVAQLVGALRKVSGVALVFDAKTPSAAFGAGLSQSALKGHHANEGEGTGGSAHLATEPEQQDQSIKTEVQIGRPRTDGWLSRNKVRWVFGAVATFAALLGAGFAFFHWNLPWTRPIAIHGPKPLYMPFKTGDVFQECAECPEMVVIVPDPTVLPTDMPASEAQKMKPYAIGKFEITRAQFRASGVQPGRGCYPQMRKGLDEKLNAEHPGFEQGADHPVVCISRNEIQGYLAWLNKQNGLKLAYRLPAQSEWDIAARGGASAWQYWGEDNDQACEYGNVFDRTAAQTFAVSANYQCSDGYAYTAPVGQFKPNALGLHDTIGNVWEWLEDCGRSRGREDCVFRVAVGGSWAPGIMDDYRRFYFTSTDTRQDYLGFRVARTL
jgi:formylglycine-generating enzyme required for sulfatase activity